MIWIFEVGTIFKLWTAAKVNLMEDDDLWKLICIQYTHINHIIITRTVDTSDVIFLCDICQPYVFFSRLLSFKWKIYLLSKCLNSFGDKSHHNKAKTDECKNHLSTLNIEEDPNWRKQSGGRVKRKGRKWGEFDVSLSSVHIFTSGFTQIMVSKFLNVLY